MGGYQSIEKFRRGGRHMGAAYTVSVIGEGGKYYVRSIDISGYPRMDDNDSAGHASVEAAFEAGEKLARDFIEE